ncbi:MAG: dephospho-CoA kinase [Acidobacteria bacterium]|nr:MAG: dephospho-CoA kinase [Acidobacteriota bacterium]
MTRPGATAETAGEQLVADLLAPGMSLEETHVSRVFLGRDEVYKIKRPVDLGFLDFTTIERRRAACEAEVELNRRLAPEVYLGVVPVSRGADGRLRFGGGGEVVDWAVHMRRLRDADRADRRLEQGTLDRPGLERVAQVVASFHAAARADEETARFGTVEAIARNVDENFRQTRDRIHRYLDPAEAAEIERWQHDFLARNRDRFAARIAAGRVRDGHGDLRLEHVYLQQTADGPRVTIIDCIEFNQRFRFADVCADVAFLAMDLAWHRRVDLAEHFLARYARAAQDFDLYPLAGFYESYRAYVRGKVAAMLAADAAVSEATRRRAAAEARRYFLLALACGRRPLLEPVVVAVGGVIASGKSTLAEALAETLSAPIVDSDRTRKHLLGVPPEQPVRDGAFAGGYAPEVSRGVYEEVLRRAAAVLDSGRPVILDATFRSRRDRRAARRLAARYGVPFFFLECRAPVAELRRRLVRRARQGGVSDGRLEILDDFLDRWQPVAGELPPEEHLVIDSGRPLADQLARLGERLPAWPGGLTA